MRSLGLLLALLTAGSVAVASAAADGDMKLVRVWPQWKEEESFMGISEYFTHREADGGWIVLRTHPESRKGFYFLARLKNPGPAAAGDTFVIHLILPDSPDPRTFTFPAAIPHGSHVFEIGLTGKDWTTSKLHPVAWRFEVLNAAGRIVAAKSSYLWEKPTG